MNAPVAPEREAPAGSPLGGIGRAELAELVSVAEPFAVADGVLFRQGDVADAMYVLEAGEIELVARTPADDVMTLGRATAGSVFGELSLLDRGLRSATARVIEPAAGWRLGQHAFQVLRAARRPAGTALLARLAALTCARIRARVADLASTLASAPAPVLAAGADVDPGRWAAGSPFAVDAATAVRLPFFLPFSDRERAELCARGLAHAVPRGERLAVAGRPAEATLVVVSGAVVRWLEREGRLERCGVAAPGRTVAVVDAIDGGPAAFDAAAREDALLLRLDRATLRELRGAGELGHKLDDVLVPPLAREPRRVTRARARLAAHGRFPLRG